MEIYLKEIFRDFLLKINTNENWEKLILEIELQPNYIGISGTCLLNNQEEISLRTRTEDEFDATIVTYHKINSSNRNKWNKISFHFDINNNEVISFVWDQKWQHEVDKINKDEKKKNSNYNLPKWHWD